MDNRMFQNIGDSHDDDADSIRGGLSRIGGAMGELARAFGINIEELRKEEQEKTRQRLIASAIKEFETDTAHAEALVDLQMFTGLGDNETIAKNLYDAMEKEFIPLVRGLMPWAKIRALIGKPTNAREVLYEKLYDEGNMRISGLLEHLATVAMIVNALVDHLKKYSTLKEEYFSRGRKEAFSREKLLLAAGIVLKTRLDEYDQENDLK